MCALVSAIDVKKKMYYSNCAHMCALVSAIDVKKKMYYKYLKSFSNVFIVQKILCTVYVL